MNGYILIMVFKVVTYITYFLFALNSLSISRVFSQDIMNHYPVTKPLKLVLNPGKESGFEVDYNKIKLYYAGLNQNYIIPADPETIRLKDPNQAEMNLNLKELKFKVNESDSAIIANNSLGPESVQDLFYLNEGAYLKYYKAGDFLSAKKNSYQQTGFSVKKQKYYKDYYQFWDWKSLNHPPIKELTKPLDFYDLSRTEINYDTINSPFFSDQFHKYIDRTTGTHLTFGNKLRLLENGESYEKKIELIRNAKSSIFAAVMSYYKDSSSLRMSEELIRKAASGVHVVLLVEKVWTKIMMKKGLRDFPKNNITVLYADDLMKYDERERALFHNKFWVFDDDIAILGGQNILDSENISTGFNHQSRDTDLLVQGPAVTDISISFFSLLDRFDYKKKCSADQITYLEAYRKSIENRLGQEEKEGVRGQQNYAEKLNNINTRMDGVCRYIIQGPQTDKNLISKVYLHYLKQVEQTVDMNTGKINFDLNNQINRTYSKGWHEDVWKQIFKLAEKGRKINLISNGKDGGYGELSNHMKRKTLLENDNKFYRSAFPTVAERLDKKAAKRNYPYLDYLQKLENFEVWFYFQYMHSKTVFLDRIVVSVSSYNLDSWSADRSHESALICQDKVLAKQYEYNYVRDLCNSTPVPEIKKLVQPND